MKRTSLVDSDRRPGSGYFGRVFRPKPATSLGCPGKDPNLTGQIVSGCGMPRSLGAPYFSRIAGLAFAAPRTLGPADLPSQPLGFL